MHIALVTPGWPAETTPNGIATYVKAMSSELRQRGTTVSIIAVTGEEDPEAGVFQARPVRTGPVRRIARAAHYRIDPAGCRRRAKAEAICAAAERARKKYGRIDLLEIEESFGWGGMVASRLGAPVVVRLHGPWFLVGSALGLAEDDDFRPRAEAELSAMTQAAAVSSPAEHALRAVQERLPSPLRLSAVIPNPVETGNGTARWNGDSANPRVIAFVGRFDRVKGADVLLRAFVRVKREVPDARLVFAGPDRGLREPSGATVDLPTFVARETPRDVAGAIEFLGQVPSEEARRVRLHGSVTVTASRYETFPYSLLEAMAAGCPCVATRSTGMMELVEHERTGLLFTNEDHQDLADKLIQLLRDRDRAAALGRAAAEHAATTYSPGVIGTRMMEFYSSVVRS